MLYKRRSVDVALALLLAYCNVWRPWSHLNSDRQSSRSILHDPFWESSCQTVTGRPSNRRWSRYGGLHPQSCAVTFVLSTWDWLPCLELVLPEITALPRLGWCSRRPLGRCYWTGDVWALSQSFQETPANVLWGSAAAAQAVQARVILALPAGQTIGLLSFDNHCWGYLTLLTNIVADFSTFIYCEVLKGHREMKIFIRKLISPAKTDISEEWQWDFRVRSTAGFCCTWPDSFSSSSDLL